ncbi:MAG: MaoC family dehydratase N-terminal domain-containing protein [Desulfosarcina sp.]|nr:MaoC family dehydratase N-terminal domain-containing protein [Desulfobacterales bacterium]
MSPKYFEDIEIGEREETGGRTVTQADIVNFAGLSGDFNPIHINADYAGHTYFKQPIAHGLLVVAIASGLFTQSNLNTSIKSNLIALIDLKWKFLKPVFPGDTIYVEIEIIEKRQTSKADRGLLINKRTIVNQHGEPVQEGEVVLMIKRRSIR